MSKNAASDDRDHYKDGLLPLKDSEDSYDRHLVFDHAVAIENASNRERFEAIGRTLRDLLTPQWLLTEKTYHDGFTLNDLVSYSAKRNQGNGEDNRDGMNDNLSWNCGTDGPVEDPEIERLRVRQIKNFHLLNMLSFGTPMLLMGDEIRRTQQGNNNAYCQDNEISWLDWDLNKRHAGLHRFVRIMATFRARRELVTENLPLTLNELLRQARLEWHGVNLNRPDWGEDSHSIALTVSSLHERFTLHAMLNAYWEPLTFELPAIGEQRTRRWQRWVDTSLPSPEDIAFWENSPILAQSEYVVGPRSIVLLVELNRLS